MECNKIPYRYICECPYTNDISDDDNIRVCCDLPDGKDCPSEEILKCIKIQERGK